MGLAMAGKTLQPPQASLGAASWAQAFSKRSEPKSLLETSLPSPVSSPFTAPIQTDFCKMAMTQKLRVGYAFRDPGKREGEAERRVYMRRCIHIHTW